MKTLTWFAFAALLVCPTVQAQDKPGPEHEVLKKMEGNWDLVMTAAGMECKGTVTWKMDLGGLWLTGSMESEMFGTKFQGKSLDTYSPAKKKYTSIWVDSMSTGPVLTEGTFDKEKKTLTLAGEGPGMDGKATKYKSTSVMKDDNTIEFAMWIGDGKDPMFTVVYKRKK